MKLDGDQRRARLASAQLMLIFTPELTGERDALEVALALAAEVDILQVRPKPAPSEASDPRKPGSPNAPAEARATFEWCARLLESFADLPRAPLVLVDDRVDVAVALADRGCAGVHLGRHDFPVDAARRQLGADALIGLSTHDVSQVVLAGESGADYIGFGPIFATSTKGYERGIGPETAWVANTGSPLPLFPIGGIDESNAHTLVEVGRVAVASSLLTSPDPRAAARRIRAALNDS